MDKCTILSDGDSYFIIPIGWNYEDIVVVDGDLYYKGVMSYTLSGFYIPKEEMIRILNEEDVDFPSCIKFMPL
jgi:hypothetical protein